MLRVVTVGWFSLDLNQATATLLARAAPSPMLANAATAALLALAALPSMLANAATAALLALAASPPMLAGGIATALAQPCANSAFWCSRWLHVRLQHGGVVSCERSHPSRDSYPGRESCDCGSHLVLVLHRLYSTWYVSFTNRVANFFFWPTFWPISVGLLSGQLWWPVTPRTPETAGERP